jgi:hypothetical protein
VVVRTKTVHRILKDKANRVRIPKGLTWVTSLDKASQEAKVARDSLVRWAEEEIRVLNQEEDLIPAVQVHPIETGSKMFPALKTTIQTWTRI